MSGQAFGGLGDGFVALAEHCRDAVVLAVRHRIEGTGNLGFDVAWQFVDAKLEVRLLQPVLAPNLRQGLVQAEEVHQAAFAQGLADLVAQAHKVAGTAGKAQEVLGNRHPLRRGFTELAAFAHQLVNRRKQRHAGAEGAKNALAVQGVEDLAEHAAIGHRDIGFVQCAFQVGFADGAVVLVNLAQLFQGLGHPGRLFLALQAFVEELLQGFLGTARQVEQGAFQDPLEQAEQVLGGQFLVLVGDLARVRKDRIEVGGQTIGLDILRRFAGRFGVEQ